jgi:protein TonB
MDRLKKEQDSSCAGSEVGMFAERQGSFFARSGPAIAVVGLHGLILYGLILSMGIVEMPKFVAPVEAIFIPEQTQQEPEPQIKVKPQIDEMVPTETPPPEVQFDEAVVPPAETSIPASENAISATSAESAPSQDLKTTNRVEPIYPSSSRRAGEEGTVRVKVFVDENGRPKEVAIAKSSGFSRLDQTALEAVRKWRFVAATNAGTPVSTWTQVAITFRLTSANR